MSDSENLGEEESAPEIVIIRRGGGGHEEGHHGGMWKIAYADFMTAMMALFLVMWLVNATDEETQAQIASYFNPIELSANTTNDRGVHDQNQAGTGERGQNKPKKSGNVDNPKAPRNDLNRRGNTDEALFSDPYEVLTKLAARASKVPLPRSDFPPQADVPPASGGEAFRDPFDPNFRHNSNEENANNGDFDPTYKTDKKGKDKSAPDAMPFADKLAEEADKADKADEQKDKQPEQIADSQEAKNVRSELLKTVQQSGLAKLPDISVRQTEEGVLISMTDQANFEMFSVSSAKPKPELVVLIEKLAEILAKETGDIIVRGHTDARPFRSKTYDNWRLSTARAHIAHYMLMHGGLPKERIKRIEGYADRSLKVPSDPFAAQNRRIEILLKPGNA